MEKPKLSKKTITQYGVAGYAAMFTFTIVTLYGLYFFTDVVGINPAVSSTILMIGTLWDAVTDPIIGNWSDGRMNRKGRRRPVILGVALPFGIVSWLLFTDFHFSGTVTVVYFVVMIMAFFTAQTFLDISYTSLGAEISRDYDERSALSNSRGIWGCLAGTVASFTLVIVSMLDSHTGSSRVSWSIMSAGFALLCVLSILYTWKKTEGLEATGDAVKAIKKEKFSYHDLIHGPLRNKSFLSVTGMFTFAIIAQAFYSACIVYYMIYNMQMTEMQVSIASLLLYLAGFVSLPLIEKVSVKYGKKASWNVFIGLMIVSAMVLIFWLLKPGMVWGVYLNSILMSAAFQAFYIVPWAMIPDTIEVDEYVTGQRREGLYYGVVTCVQKLGSSLAISASGIYLTWIGYNAAAAEQSQRALDGLRYICSVGTVIPLVLSVICTVLNPMTKQMHRKLLDAIQEKKQLGGAYEEDKEMLKKLRF